MDDILPLLSSTLTVLANHATVLRVQLGKGGPRGTIRKVKRGSECRYTWFCGLNCAKHVYRNDELQALVEDLVVAMEGAKSSAR